MKASQIKPSRSAFITSSLIGDLRLGVLTMLMTAQSCNVSEEVGVLRLWQ